MNAEQLRYLIVISENSSLVAAAKQLGITQQALGQSLSQLERELGVKLINRGSGGNSPTVFGKQLLRHARIIDTEMRRAIQEIEGLKGASYGSIAIGVGEGFAGALVSSAISAFQEQRPGVNISLVEDYTANLLPRAVLGELDLVLGAPVANPRDIGDFETEEVGSTWDAVYARVGHSIFERRQLTISDLWVYPWLVTSDGWEDHKTVIEILTEEGMAPDTRVIECDGTLTGLSLLFRDDYLIFVAPELVHDFVKHNLIRKIPVERPTRHRKLLVWRYKSRVENPTVEPFCECIAEAISLREQLPGD